jgi:hypothetical protein
LPFKFNPYSRPTNIFLFLAAKFKNTNFLNNSNVRLPAYVDFREGV